MKAALCLLIGAYLQAAPPVTLELDATRTKVEWTLEDVLHTVRGTFQMKAGLITFSPEGGKAEGQIVVDAKSGNSGNGLRDRKMHSSVLESDRYPEVTFTPDGVEGKIAMTGASQIQVHGILRIHGQDHPIVLPVKAVIDNGAVQADSHLSIPYANWGIKNPSTLFLKVGDKVELDIHAAGIIRQSQ